MKLAPLFSCLVALSILATSLATSSAPAHAQDVASVIEFIDSQTLVVASLDNNKQLSRWPNLLNLPGEFNAQDLGDGHVAIIMSPAEIRLILNDPTGERGKNFQARNVSPAYWKQTNKGGVTTLVRTLSGGQTAISPLNDTEKKRWQTALAQRGSDPLFVAVAPADQTRRVINELALAVPRNNKGVNPARICETLEWVSWSFDNGESAHLKMTFQAIDDSRVLDLVAELEKVAAMLRVSPVDPDLARELAKILFANKPKIEGAQVVYESSGGGNPELQRFMEKLLGQQEANASKYSVKQIVLAMHNYESAFKHFPGPAIGEGKSKGLSWRVAMLPYLDQMELYQQFHLDEPWDSEHNKTLIPKMPRVFQYSGSKRDLSEGLSNYVVPTGPGLAFEAGKESKFSDFRDGSSNTVLVMVVDDEHAEIWTRPVEQNFDPENPRAGLRLSPLNEFLFGLGDGSVNFMKATLSDDMLRALMTRDGAEPIILDQ